MSSIILALALLSIATFFLVILSAYSYLSVNEYKRRARTGDLSARKIYQVLLYGKQLNLVIWFIIGLLSAISLVISSCIVDKISSKEYNSFTRTSTTKRH